MKKSFNVQAQNVNGTNGGVQSMREMLLGKTIVVLKQVQGHNYGTNGTKIKIPDNHNIGFGGGSGNRYSTINIGFLDNKQYNNIPFTAFSVFEAETLAELKAEIALYKKEKEGVIKDYDKLIADAKAKIDYMKEVGSDKFQENEFKAYRTLQLVENDGLSRIEKARLIAELIN